MWKPFLYAMIAIASSGLLALLARVLGLF